jgi:hypothetical protein
MITDEIEKLSQCTPEFQDEPAKQGDEALV